MADGTRRLPLVNGLDGYSRTRLGLDHQRRYGPAQASTGALPAGEAALAVLHHEFIRERREGVPERDEQHAARVCFEQMHREYALCDLSRWREGKVGLRWRTEAEVLAGKGQFQCGSLSCDGVLALHSYELPFRYSERGVQKEALVKVRVCGRCAPKLFGRTASSAAEAPSYAGGGGSSRSRRASGTRPPGHEYAAAGAESAAAARVPSRMRGSSRSRSPPARGSGYRDR